MCRGWSSEQAALKSVEGCDTSPIAPTVLPVSSHSVHHRVLSLLHHTVCMQRAALPHAIAGRDILGAAKTGSGKTLTFLIPVRSGAGFEGDKSGGHLGR